MIVAIHNRTNSFSDYWIKYCQRNNIAYKLVNAFDNNIIEQVKYCDIFMWHHHHMMYKDVLAARKILFALEHAGIIVFPNFKTGWYFDDKVAQKYLLEAIEAPIIPTYVFYEKREALKWAEKTSYPKVWKLKGGSSGRNVRLVQSKKHARKLILKSFGKGFSQYNKLGSLNERFKLYKEGKNTFTNVLKGFTRIFVTTEFAKMIGNEKGYVYFQDFIPDNTRDNRIIIINNRAFGVSRLIRDGDFKSGDKVGVLSERKYIDERCVSLAFDLVMKLKTQSLGVDFIFDEDNRPVIAEIGYGFVPETYNDCEGYWDNKLVWHEGDINPMDWIVEQLIHSYNNK